MVLPTLWFEGEYHLARYGGECASSTASLWINPMPPRTTRKSDRPRVPDDGIAAARKANPASNLPHTLTHEQFVDPADFPRFRELGVISALQLLWAEAGPDTIALVKPYLDPEIYKWQYPARSLLDSGAVISGASDWPVSTANVFFAIYQAETRKGPEGILDASQDMPRLAMFYAYTRNSARAMNLLDKIGSIAPGKRADLILLDRDVLTISPENMRDTKVLWTVVAGQTVQGSAQ